MEILFDRDMEGIFTLQIHRDYANQQDVGNLKMRGMPTVIKSPDLVESDQSTVGYPMTHDETKALREVNYKQEEASGI